MISAGAWANVVRADPMRRRMTELDRYVQREYGGPDATWLFSAAEPAHEHDSTSASTTSERLVRRITQAITSFF